MKYAQLGSTGVRVSKISLGTATFGVSPNPAEAERMVGRALDLGINLFDCANSYGNQARFDRPGLTPAAERASAEEILGKALRGKRQHVVLCSKVMEPVGAGVNERGLSRLHIFDQVENSLRRLGTDHLDVYYAHHPDGNTRIDETLRAFDDLVRQGKIRYYALSTYPAWQLIEALWVCDRLGLHTPVCVQIPYNLALRLPEADVLPACVRYGISATVFSPLAGGVFSGAADQPRPIVGHQRWGGPGFTPRQLELARQLQEVAAKSGHQPAALALAWLLTRPGVCSAIIGPESVTELEVTAAAGDLELSPEVLQAVNLVGEQPFSIWSMF